MFNCKLFLGRDTRQDGAAIGSAVRWERFGSAASTVKVEAVSVRSSGRGSEVRPARVGESADSSVVRMDRSGERSAA